jgi:hypothetical protein
MPDERPAQKAEKGQSLVEFAFGVVFLLVILAVSIDVARMAYTYLALRDAAQEGAVYASINPHETTDIQFRVKNASNMLQSLGSEIDVVPVPTVNGQLCPGVTGTTVHGIKVIVSYNNFRLIAPFVGMFLGNRNIIPLRAEATSTIIANPDCN